MPLPVIVDTDIGDDVDDTWALAMALNSPELDIRLIITAGRDHHRERAAMCAKTLRAAGRDDVPLGLGCDRRAANLTLAQGGWVEAEGPEALLDGFAVHEDGVQALIDMVMQHSGSEPICLLAIGPLQNIAEALRREPALAQRCRFVGMQGSFFVGYSGAPEPAVEFNVRMDVGACRAVLGAPFISKTLSPLDTCGDLQLEGDAYRAVTSSRSPLAMAVCESYSIWSPVFVSRHPFLKDACDPAVRSSILFDCVAVYLAYAEDCLEIEEHAIEVGDDGFTRIAGEDSQQRCEGVRIALRWRDRAAFEADLLSRIAPPPLPHSAAM